MSKTQVDLTSASDKDGDLLDNMVVLGYRHDSRRRTAALLGYVMTFGFLRLLVYWRPYWGLKLTHVQCCIQDADSILIKDEYGQLFVEVIGYVKSDGIKSRFVEHKKLKYLWKEETKRFEKLEGVGEGVACSDLHACAQGLDATQQRHKLNLFGRNEILVQVKPVHFLIFHEALTPFYLFQVFTAVLWYVQDYWLYTTAVLLLSAISVSITVWETRRQTIAVSNMAKSGSVVNVCRGHDTWEEVESCDLVPGDVIEVTSSARLECDAVLLNGSVIVNESMLTGESVPVTKMPLPNRMSEKFAEESHKRHMLFCGTKVLQAHPLGGARVTALVIKTGFSTAKGELVRSILYPKPVDLKFYSDGMKFVGVSFCLGFIAMAYTGVSYVRNKVPIKEVVISVLDIITFVVPPSLPAAMTIGNLFSQRRLKRANIFCLSSKYINMSGTIDVVAFDKTGTLTEDGLSLHGVLPAEDARFEMLVEDVCSLPEGAFVAAMATCHSLVILEDELSGDPLDTIMFSSTHWILSQLPEDVTDHGFTVLPPRIVTPPIDIWETPALGIVHQFPFTSALQRMSVVTQAHAQTGYTLHVKGAPETLAQLCLPSTVPPELTHSLEKFTSSGYRVIALASKCLPQDVTLNELKDQDRSSLESDLTFLGLLVMRNSLKPETVPALMELHQANIRTLMVTGDNLLTGIHTARQCGMVPEGGAVVIVTAQTKSHDQELMVSYQVAPHNHSHEQLALQVELESSLLLSQKDIHFAMEGETFSLIRTFQPDLLEKLVLCGTVFARMRPDLKVQLVEALQDLGYTVGMCGDGANDCGALKTANTGVSLSTAEASVASPFTSRHQHIFCVPTLIREGRCALVTSFSLFKHLLATSWVFCIGILFLYKISCDFTNVQYFYGDVVMIVIPAVLFGNIEPYSSLSRVAPPPHLTSFIPIFSLVVFLGLQTTMFVILWHYLHDQPWFVGWTYGPTGHQNITSYENTLMFLTMNFAFLTSAIVFCQGPPYRKYMFHGKIFTLVAVLLFVICTVVTWKPPAFVITLFDLKFAPTIAYHGILYGTCVADLLVSLMVEDILINRVIHRKILPWIRSTFGPRRKFENLEIAMNKDPDWPPLSMRETSFGLVHNKDKVGQGLEELDFRFYT